MSRLGFPSLLIVMACGGGTSVDDTPDASAPPTVTVQTDWICCRTAGEAGQPMGGVEVVAIDPDGATRVVTTGDDGRATLAIVAGTTVTAVYRLSAGEVRLLTYTDVVDGDLLRFGELDGWGTSPTTETMRIDFPPVEGASGYELASDCGWTTADGAADHGEVWHTSACQPASEDVYVYALVDGELAFHAELRDNAFVDGGVATVAAWTPATSFTLDATGLPGGQGAGSAHVALQAYGTGSPIRGAVLGGEPTDGAFGATFPWTSAADYMAATVGMWLANGCMHRRVEPFPPGETSRTLDGSIVLPSATDVALDVAARTVRYTLDEGAPYDATVARVIYIRPGVETAEIEVKWNVYGPPAGPGAYELVLPDLPSGYDDLDIGAATNKTSAISLIDLDKITGYDAFRTLPMFDADGYQGAREGARYADTSEVMTFPFRRDP